jgi:Leucine-rich repeat (LRR) protein
MLANVAFRYLDQNFFTGTIPDIGNLIKLQNLVLNQNQLNGTIPSSIGNLIKLNIL